MGSRLDLQDVLEAITTHVYFQPPETFKMEYPCIVYSRNKPAVMFADGIPYMVVSGYRIMVIDENPDSAIPGQIAILPTCNFERHYTANNLNHDVYNLYY